MINNMESDKIFEYDPVIYPLKLWIYIGEEFSKLNNKFDEPIEPLDEDEDAVTYEIKQGENSGILILFRNRSVMTTQIIAHESSHAAMFIFDYINSEISTIAQEPFAYLLGWVAKCCEITKINIDTNIKQNTKK